jgi:hypothetical protein
VSDERTDAGVDSAPAQIPEPAEADEASPRPPSDTVGTGSYIAVTCSVVMVIITAIALGILFLTRWL